jgi:hypothetical protein
MKYSRAALVALIVLVALSGRTPKAVSTLDDATILAVFDQANQADLRTSRSNRT